ncbi:DUF4148 domain-containing protein [Undibacterium sp. TJN25]|uniref:DUF4148 domain-containing protein n=1 Tax=Undibacterium sp. TJN25 TaxID=3413056 RepID=UPI003BF1C0B2
MNAKKLVILLALAAASSVAFSQEISVSPNAAGKTREQVVNELREARQQGTLFSSDYDWPTFPVLKSTLTRAEVVAEVKEARQDGSLLADSDYDYPHISPVAAGTGKTRAQVKQELAMARADGTLFVSDWDYPVVSHPQAGSHAAVAAGASGASHG